MTPLNQMFQIRGTLINIYKKYERFIGPIIKFILIVSALFFISNSIGYADILNKTSVILALGLIGVFLPPRTIMLLFILNVSMHAGAGSLGAGIIVLAILIIIYLLFVRLYPEESMFIIATVMSFKFGIPYIIPLFAGLFSTLPAIVSLIIGITIWYGSPQIIVMMEEQGAELVDIVDIINAKLIAFQEAFTSDKTLLANIIILSLVLLIVHIIKKQKIDYAEYMAIFIGTIVNLVGFLLAIIIFGVDVSVFGLIISTLISAVISIIAQFFFKVADYDRAEKVQFEDDENYYYVKIVPKIKIESFGRKIQKNYTKDNIGGKSYRG